MYLLIHFGMSRKVIQIFFARINHMMNYYYRKINIDSIARFHNKWQVVDLKYIKAAVIRIIISRFTLKRKIFNENPPKNVSFNPLDLFLYHAEFSY